MINGEHAEPSERDFQEYFKQLPAESAAAKRVKKLSREDQRELMCEGGVYVQAESDDKGMFDVKPADVYSMATEALEKVDRGEVTLSNDGVYGQLQIPRA